MQYTTTYILCRPYISSKMHIESGQQENITNHKQVTFLTATKYLHCKLACFAVHIYIHILLL